MSIKTIDQSVRSNTAGLEKRINKGAEKMVFDILQSTQYSTPIPSTIRELVTNACDSQREKEVAIEILTGEKKEADYYIRRDGDQYADSNFDPTYYELSRLNKDFNDVTINYYRNEGVGFCDRVEIIDHGVGIGDRRLEGVLELGYSTKRNTSQNFGAFGLGAKVALSTGVDFYTIETVHNGKRFKCNCYPYKTDFLIPKFNPSITFSDGTEVHYEPTEDKNYTVVSFGVKKHNRSRYENAISDQLTYLDNVRFFIKEGEDSMEVNFRSEVIHNSNTLVVTNYGTYYKPHIIIVKEPGSSTGINYGYVDFRELEMEQLFGNVGLKCPIRQAIKDPDTGEEVVIQDGVEVTPSREKVIWNEHTKQFIQGVIDRAADEATSIVEKGLKEDDFLMWVNTCRDVLFKNNIAGNSGVLKQLSKIIDTNKMSPKYPKDKSIKFSGPQSLLDGLSVKYVTQYIKKGKIHIETESLKSWADVNFDKIYFREEAGRSRNKDLYLTDGGTKAVIITCTADSEPEVLQYLKDSSLLKSYDDLEVPEDWLSGLKDKEEVIEQNNALTGLTREERRKVEQRIVAFTLRRHHTEHSNYILDKVEPKLSTVMSSDRLTYYGTKEDQNKLVMAANMLASQAPLLQHIVNKYIGYTEDGPSFYVDEKPVRFQGWYKREFDEEKLKSFSTPQLLRVSKANVKYVSKNPNCKHIDEFFCQWDAETNTISMDKHAGKWMAASAIGDVPRWIGDCSFIPGWKDLYDKLIEVRDIYRPYRIPPAEECKEVMDLMNRILEFQNFAATTDDADALAFKSKELFIVNDVSAAKVFDPELIRLAKVMEEICDEISPLMQNINFAVYDTAGLERELTHYLKSRGKLDIEVNMPQSNP